MALSESADSDLLDAPRVGEGTDLVRELAQWALQQLIDAEATEVGTAARPGDNCPVVPIWPQGPFVSSFKPCL